MARSYGKKDLRVTHNYDLLFTKDELGNYDIARTDMFPSHTFAQVLYLAIKTDKGSFKLEPVFGASPARYTGQPMTPDIFARIENFVSTALVQSQINDDKLSISIKTVPMTRSSIAMRVEVRLPRDPETLVTRIDMLYSTSDNTVYPLFNGFGGRNG